jgi:hypothetical protein
MRVVHCRVYCNGHVTVASRLSQDSVAAERQQWFLCLFKGVAYFSRYGKTVVSFRRGAPSRLFCV